MRIKQFQIARIFGIPLIIDYSWPPMALLHLWLVSQFWLARGLGEALPQWQYFALGAVITAFFFASVLAHELAHALVARLEGIEIYDIQLHIFGGWARLIGEPRTAMAELRVAIAGPASSFLLAILFYLGLLTVQSLGSRSSPFALAAASSFYYLAAANLLLAMFNLLPGLPLDGGRVLRAILWHRSGDILAATRMAKRLGVGIAYMLISYGLFLFGYGIFRNTFWHDFLVAIWLLIVGVFLMNAAESDYRHHASQQASREPLAEPRRLNWNVAGTVGSVMSAPPVCVAPELVISEFLDRILNDHRHTSFPVARDGRLHGILSLARLREVPEQEWERLAVGEVMEPVDDSLFVTVRTSIAHAAYKLRANQLGHLAVLDGEGMLVGYLSEDDLKRAA
jgi:Zn-dependent protease